MRTYRPECRFGPDKNTAQGLHQFRRVLLHMIILCLLEGDTVTAMSIFCMFPC